MRVVAWIIAIINALFGLNALLNALGILQSSKYGNGTTWFVALLFTGLAAWSLYTLFGGGSARQALWLGLAPWLIALVVMFFTLALGNWQ